MRQAVELDLVYACSNGARSKRNFKHNTTLSKTSCVRVTGALAEGLFSLACLPSYWHDERQNDHQNNNQQNRERDTNPGIIFKCIPTSTHYHHID